jgi:hypothetical protein
MVPTVASARAEQLASLALSAATELDKLSRGRGASMEPVTQFSKALSDVPGWAQAPQGGALGLDPFSSEMLSTAVMSVTRKHVSNLTDLATELELLKQQFQAVSSADQKQALATVKAFCLAIHDFVMRTYFQSGLVEQGVFDHEYHSAG